MTTEPNPTTIIEDPQVAWLGFPIDRVGLFLGPLLLIVQLAFVDPGALTPEAHRLSAVLLLTVTWWVTEPIPIAATALLSVVLCVCLGAVPATADGRFEPARAILAPFAEPSVFFLLGGLFIGRAMTLHGLDRRLALGILCSRWAGRSPATVLAAVGLGTMLVSMWISNTAATAMTFPITLGIINVLAGEEPISRLRFLRSPYATSLLLICAYASSVGGIATPIGTATNVLAIGYFKRPEYFGQSIDFLRWMLVGVPMMLLIFACLTLWLHWLFPGREMNMPALRQYLHDQATRLGRWKVGEINTLAVFLIVVSLWIAPPILQAFTTEWFQKAFANRFPEEIVALMAPVLLFLLPIDWKNRRFTLSASDFLAVDWGTLLLFGAGLALGNLMFRTGLADAVGRTTFAWLGTTDIWVLVAFSTAAAILLSEFTGNAAAAATLLPVVLALCKEAKLAPTFPLLAVTFGASFGSALPVSTPPNAIVYGSGLIPVRRMVLAGVGIDVVCGLAIWTILRVAGALAWSPLQR